MPSSRNFPSIALITENKLILTESPINKYSNTGHFTNYVTIQLDKHVRHNP